MAWRVALLGWPVGHSVSPAMQNAAFAAAGVSARYEALAVPPDQLPAAVMALRGAEWLGANVTIPHKQAVLPLLDRLDPAARLIGAVNTIARREGRLEGYNTDWSGFLADLHAEGVRPAGQRACILGAGGAARAVAVALAVGQVSRVAVLNRTPERAQEVAAAAREAARLAGRDLPVAAVPLEGDAARLELAASHLVVNCTPLGMHPATAESPLAESLGALPVGSFVYDTVYRPDPTRLVREARARGLRAVAGLGMLVQQGALSWLAWLGQRGPAEVMRAAAEQALAGTG